jgi:hypothetical protein
MALNPHSEAIRASASALRTVGPFQTEAAAALGAFQEVRAGLARQVRNGRLTPRVAREQAAAAASALRDDLSQRAAAVTSAPSVLADRVASTLHRRRADAARPSFGTLQRETNQLLRQNLLEQQLTSRSAEFQARAYLRPLGGGAPAPSLESLLAFAAGAEAGADEPAREWARRQLESFRSFVHTDDDLRRLDAACDRPEQVNPRTVTRYLASLAEATAEELERFASEAVASRDASAGVAAALLARSLTTADESPAWVQSLLDGLDSLPSPALEAISSHIEAERAVRAESAEATVQALMFRAEAEARMPNLEAPTEAEVARIARAEARPLADASQPIGLAPAFRGRSPEEIAAQPPQTTA